jgi:ATP-dependent helicase/nuclease subunit A
MTDALNPEQRAAAECLDRPVLVTAGAGSGKTRMLAHRYANAVVPGAVGGWTPAGIDEIVAITFTDKAAGEITGRVRLTMQAAGLSEAARAIDEGWISTIHGLCSRLLRRHAFDAGVDPLFSVADTVHVGKLRETAFEEAVNRVLAEGEGGVRLFDRYRYDALFAACVAVTRKLAVLGDPPESMLLEPAEDARCLLGEAEDLFRRGATTCNMGYAGTSSNPVEHAECCEELSARCSTLRALEDEAVLSELLAMLDAYKPLKSLKGLEEVAVEIAAERASLCGRVAAAVVSPYAIAFGRLVGEFSAAYQRRKSMAGVLDFDDLQVRAVELLERRPDLAQRYRRQFRVVMIDEFQDTDALQLRLVEALSDGDLCTVGDEKQSIYRFRGADIDVYRGHRAKMRADGALVAELAVNYRSCADLLSFVNGVFGSEEYFGAGPAGLLKLQPAEARGPAPAEGGTGDDPRVEMLFIDVHDTDKATARLAEATWIARRLREMCEAGARAGDVAVLVRSYTHAHVYAEALSAEGLRAVVVGGSRFFGLPEVAVMRALNRVIANPRDGAAMGILLVSDFVPLSSDALAILRLRPEGEGRLDLWDAMRRSLEELGREDHEAAQRLIAVLRRAHDRAGSAPLAEVLLLAVEEAGWDLRLLSAGNAGRDAFANVLKFARQAAEFEAAVGMGHAGFALHLDAKERLGDTEAPASLADDHSDAVRIMSVHASKGLEFPIVVVPDLAARGGADSLSVRTSVREAGLALALKTPIGADGEAPSVSTWFAAFTDEDKLADAEERARVLYVAFTRARERLLVSGSMDMRPKRPPTALHDLARLARVFGVAIPAEGESDTLALGPEGARCRVRVVDAAGLAPTRDADGPVVEGVRMPPPAGEVTAETPRVVAPERLSYTQLSEFEHCPKHFWARRVIGARRVATDATQGADPLRFGTALHAVLRLVTSVGNPPRQARIEAISRHHELDAAEASRLEAAVERYCASDQARRAIAGDTVRRETPFAMRVGDSFLLTGSIDLYSRTGDSAFVIDYKSGHTGEGAELADRYRLQAECYALAVLRDGCGHADVEFVRPEVEVEGDTMQRVAFSFDAGDAARIERDLIRRYEEISNSTFEPLPSRECAHCDIPLGLCPEMPSDHRGNAD